MRRLLAYCIPFCVAAMAIGSSLTCSADSCTALSGGSWSTPATWSCGHEPQAGDLIVIPEGLTVTVHSNIAYSGASMRLKIYGALYFVGGGSKLSFPCGSIVEIMTPTASVDGDSEGNSQTIKICGIVYWEVREGYTTGYLAWPAGSTLPVQLLYFQGNANNTIVDLSWATASETNTDRFELHRLQENGSSELVAILPAAGSSQHMLVYRSQDHPSALGAWDYRLVQYDLDGASTDLGTISVRTEMGVGLLCHPIPASHELIVSTTDLPATLVMRDPQGREVSRVSLVDESTVIPVDHLPNGPYLAQVVNGDRISTQRVQVTR